MNIFTIIGLSLIGTALGYWMWSVEMRLVERRREWIHQRFITDTIKGHSHKGSFHIYC